MEDSENKKSNNQDPDTVFFKTVPSRKRIYYMDVKRGRNGGLFLTITERKKVLSKESSQPVFVIEKHKIFLYKEDFDKFFEALNETLTYIKDNDFKDNDIIDSAPRENETTFNDPINLNINF